MSYVIKLFTVWIFLKVNTFFADSFMFWYVPISLYQHILLIYSPVLTEWGLGKIWAVLKFAELPWSEIFYELIPITDIQDISHARTPRPTKLRMECWKKRVFWWWAARAPDPPAAGRRSSGAPAGWATAAPAACPGSGWSSAASSGRQGCRSRGHAESWWSYFVNSQQLWDLTDHDDLKQKHLIPSRLETTRLFIVWEMRVKKVSAVCLFLILVPRTVTILRSLLVWVERMQVMVHSCL